MVEVDDKIILIGLWGSEYDISEPWTVTSVGSELFKVTQVEKLMSMNYASYVRLAFSTEGTTWKRVSKNKKLITKNTSLQIIRSNKYFKRNDIVKVQDVYHDGNSKFYVVKNETQRDVLLKADQLNWKYIVLNDKGEDAMKEILKRVKDLNKKQFRIYNRLYEVNKRDALEYLCSLSGFSTPNAGNLRRRLKDIKKKSDKVDVLSTKKPKHYLDVMKSIFKVHNGSHKPLDTKFGEWCGVEIECFVPIKGLGETTTVNCGECSACENDEDTSDCESPRQNVDYDSARNVLRKMISDRKIKYVGMSDDGSIDCNQDEFFPIEFKLLTLSNDFSNLKKFCDFLKEVGAQVNKSCGLHVHFDARELSQDKQITVDKRKQSYRGRRVANSLDVLKLLIPNSRRTNSYCKLQMSGRDRYSAVNLVALNRHQTIEIRLHSGTTNFTKIVSWIKLINDIMNCARLSSGAKKATSLDDLFLKLYGAKDKWTSEQNFRYRFFDERIKKFTKNENEESEQGVELIETGASTISVDGSTARVWLDNGTTSIITTDPSNTLTLDNTTIYNSVADLEWRIVPTTQPRSLETIAQEQLRAIEAIEDRIELIRGSNNTEGVS